MIYIGNDIIEVSRIKESIDSYGEKFIKKIFNTEEIDRPLQDIGLDGLTDTEEKDIYTNGKLNDPAGDNYTFYVQAEGNILDRYKNG